MRQLHSLGERAQAVASFAGPQLGTEKAREKALKELEAREKAERKMARERRRIEKDLRNEEIAAERTLLRRFVCSCDRVLPATACRLRLLLPPPAAC